MGGAGGRHQRRRDPGADQPQGASQARRTGLWAIWVNTTTQGRIRDSLQWAHELLDEGEKARDLDLRIFGHGAAMISSFYLGQLSDASKHGDAVLALYDPQQARRWMQVTAHDLRTLVGVWECQWTWMLGIQTRRSCSATRRTLMPGSWGTPSISDSL